MYIFYTKKGDYVEVRVGKAATYKEVTQACYLAILDGDRGSSSEDADDDNNAESLVLFIANGTWTTQWRALQAMWMPSHELVPT